VLGQGSLLSRTRLPEHMSKLRILLADDHPGIRALVQDLLDPVFEVIGTADNGQSLVRTALRLQPDVIIMDISMPILSGIEAARQLKMSGSRAKVVFLTVHSGAEFVRACLHVGASGYVVKVRMDTDLLPAVREALAGRVFISPTGDHQN
jgi:DNA-binding NarL/FixJ family response regulator